MSSLFKFVTMGYYDNELHFGKDALKFFNENIDDNEMKDDDDVPILKFQIISTRNIENKSEKRHVSYTVKVFFTPEDSVPVTLERRYTDFLTLYEALDKKFPNKLKISFPKKALTGNFSQEIIKNRIQGFEIFLNVISKDVYLKQSDIFTSFLHDKEHDNVKNLLNEKNYVQALFIVENSFFLLSKIHQPRSCVVLRYLCLLIALLNTFEELNENHLKLVYLALNRYNQVCDIDLLRYYVPLLHTAANLLTKFNEDVNPIHQKLKEMKRKGMRVDSTPTLLELLTEEFNS